MTDAGIKPLPLQRPIPIWMGGGADPVMDRIGRLADGWFYPGDALEPDDSAVRSKGLITAAAHAAGRDPGEIGIEKVFSHGNQPDGGWPDAVAAWTDYGATHVSFNTMNSGLGSLDEHLSALKGFIDAVRP